MLEGIAIAGATRKLSRQQIDLLGTDFALQPIGRLRERGAQLGEQKAQFMTIGVLVAKSEKKFDKGGRPFCLWKLSGLARGDEEYYVPFLMYEGAVADAWKHPLGNVYLMVNPSVLPPREGAKADDVCFKLDKSAQLQMVGVAEHYGVCEGVIKGGAKGGCKCEVDQPRGGQLLQVPRRRRPPAQPPRRRAEGRRRRQAPCRARPRRVVQPPPDVKVGSFFGNAIPNPTQPGWARAQGSRETPKDQRPKTRSAAQEEGLLKADQSGNSRWSTTRTRPTPKNQRTGAKPVSLSHRLPVVERGQPPRRGGGGGGGRTGGRRRRGGSTGSGRETMAAGRAGASSAHRGGRAAEQRAARRRCRAAARAATRSPEASARPPTSRRARVEVGA